MDWSFTRNQSFISFFRLLPAGPRPPTHTKKEDPFLQHKYTPKGGMIFFSFASVTIGAFIKAIGSFPISYLPQIFLTYTSKINIGLKQCITIFSLLHGLSRGSLWHNNNAVCLQGISDGCLIDSLTNFIAHTPQSTNNLLSLIFGLRLRFKISEIQCDIRVGVCVMVVQYPRAVNIFIVFGKFTCTEVKEILDFWI